MMLSESSSGSSFCFMRGVTSSNNSAVFDSDNDLNKGNNTDPSSSSSDQFDLLLIPSSSMEIHKKEEDECQPLKPVQEPPKQQGNNNVDVIIHVAPLRKLKLEIIPSCLSKGSDSSSSSELEQDGLRTPTSSDHKIMVLECPGAPKKASSSSSRPAAAKKRKCNYYCEKQIIAVPDPSQDLESLFFPKQQHLAVDLDGAAAKIKRIKQCSPTASLSHPTSHVHP